MTCRYTAAIRQTSTRSHAWTCEPSPTPITASHEPAEKPLPKGVGAQYNTRSPARPQGGRALQHGGEHALGVGQCRLKRVGADGAEIDEADNLRRGVKQRHPDPVELHRALVGLAIGGVVDLQGLGEVVA